MMIWFHWDKFETFKYHQTGQGGPGTLGIEGFIRDGSLFWSLFCGKVAESGSLGRTVRDVCCCGHLNLFLRSSLDEI